MNYMTPVEFVTYMYQEACWSYGPEPMSVDDAAYNLREYKADGIPVPSRITPAVFARIWNICYMRDIHNNKGGASA